MIHGLQNIGKYCSEVVTGVVIGAGIVVTAPIVGTIAQPLLAIKVIWHLASANYHLRHTKDERGIALVHDKTFDYRSPDVQFRAQDLTLLEHELQRIEEVEKLFSTLRMMGKLAKCIIPIVGLIWVSRTQEHKIDPYSDSIQRRKAAQLHIDKLKEPMLAEHKIEHLKE